LGGILIQELSFEQVVAFLGEMLPAGEMTARTIYDALASMAWYGETDLEEARGKRNADVLTIALRSDAMSVCEDNAEPVCAALTDVSALCVYPHDEETFWFEVSIPCVFPEGDTSERLSITVDESQIKVYEDELLPDWLFAAMKAVKEERDDMRFEDFVPVYDRMTKLADVYAAVKMLSKSTGAVFDFTKPDPPRNMHGGVHLKVRGLFRLEKENLAALISVIKTAGALSVSSTDDAHVYLSFWVNNVYQEKK
jgi:hypothetical protein